MCIRDSPYTLGTEVGKRDAEGHVQTGFFHPIILRNSTCLLYTSRCV